MEVEITSDSDRYYLSRAVGPALDRTGRVAESYEPLCLPPCSAEIPPGLQHFGYGPVGRVPSPLALSVDISLGVTLHLSVMDRSTERTIGIFTLLTGTVGGAVLILVPTIEQVTGSAVSLGEAAIGSIVAGALLFVGGLIAGSTLAGLRDVIDLRSGAVRY